MAAEIVDNRDPALAVLYIPDQTSLVSESSGTESWSIIDNWNTWWTENQNIVIHVADIKYQAPSQHISQWNCNERFCINITDNHWSIGRYVGIQQSDMISTETVLLNNSLYINTTEATLVHIDWWSPDAKSIPTQWSVNFAKSTEHIIVSKQRIDGITWVYWLSPTFFADTHNAMPWSYEGSSIITLYYY